MIGLFACSRLGDSAHIWHNGALLPGARKRAASRQGGTVIVYKVYQVHKDTCMLARRWGWQAMARGG